MCSVLSPWQRLLIGQLVAVWPLSSSTWAETFHCLFLLFMLSLPLHEVTIPLFLFHFLHISLFFSPPSALPPPFFFFILFFFNFLKHFLRPQQVGIDQGDIPDLSQVSVHLTFPFFSSPVRLCCFYLFDVSVFPLTPDVFSLLCFHLAAYFPIYIYTCFAIVHLFCLLLLILISHQPSLTWSESR